MCQHDAVLQGAVSDNVPLVTAGMTDNVRLYGGVVVSLAVVIGFLGLVGIMFFVTIPTGSEPLANVLIGTLASMATCVVNYWLGSSAGSAAKDAKK